MHIYRIKSPYNNFIASAVGLQSSRTTDREVIDRTFKTSMDVDSAAIHDPDFLFVIISKLM